MSTEGQSQFNKLSQMQAAQDQLDEPKEVQTDFQLIEDYFLDLMQTKRMKYEADVLVQFNLQPEEELQSDLNSPIKVKQ